MLSTQETVITTSAGPSACLMPLPRLVRPVRPARPAAPAVRPARPARPVARADRSADFYRERASQWGELRATAFEAISSRAAYDLRARIATVMTEAQDHVEDTDPGRTGAELKAWLDARLVTELHGTRHGTVAAVRAFSARAAAHFALPGTVPVDPGPGRVTSDFDTARLAVNKKKNSTLSTSINIGMRAYMGFMIFFVLTQVMALAVPAWIGLLPVLLLGGVALFEEHRKRVEQRQYQASEAVAQHIGEFADRASREMEELLRDLDLGVDTAYRSRVEPLMAAV